MKRLWAALVRGGRALEGTERGTWTVLVGIAFLVGGFWKTWFLYQSSLSSSPGAGSAVIAMQEPVEAVVIRLFVLIATAFLLFGYVRGERHRFAARWGGWLVLTMTLAFPYGLQLWEPEIVLDGTQLWNSLESTVWIEMDRTYVFQQSAWRAGETIAPDPGTIVPIDNILEQDFPIRPGGGEGVGPQETFGRTGSVLTDGIDLTLFRFARLPDVFSQVLGYSNGFLNIVDWGWYYSLIGSITVLMGLYLTVHRGAGALRRDLRWLIPAWLVLACVFLTPRFVGDLWLTAASNALGRGDNLAAERDFRRAAWWKPVLHYDMLYQSRIGTLTRARHCATCAETLISVAHDDMQSARFTDAVEDLERYRMLYPTHSEVRYWIGYAYLQRGISLLNNGQDSAAAQDFWQALEYMPCDVKPWWGLALAQFHMRQFDAAAQSIEQIVRQQHELLWRRLPPKSQWFVARSWAALRHGDVGQAHAFYSLSLTPENW